MTYDELKDRIETVLAIVFAGWFAFCLLAMAYHYVAVPSVRHVVDLTEPEPLPRSYDPSLLSPDFPLFRLNSTEPELIRRWDARE